jgi:hypothetical protein
MTMRTPDLEQSPGHRQPSSASNTVLGIAMMPVLLVGAGLAISSAAVLRWKRRYQENTLRTAMRAQGRVILWTSFLEKMRASGGTCIEERFSPKGPVRFWWTQEDVYAESPHKIIDWFTMHKGGAASPFVHWCRERYTGGNGSAVLVDTRGAGKKDIYALWSECRSHSCIARWVEVAPPEILPPTPVNSGP